MTTFKVLTGLHFSQRERNLEFVNIVDCPSERSKTKDALPWVKNHEA